MSQASDPTPTTPHFTVHLWGSAVARVRLALGLLAVFLLIGVFEFDSPWKVGIAKLTELDQGAKLADFINAGQWTACLVNAIICAVLAATTPWWYRPGARPQPSPTAPASPWWQRVLSSRVWWIVGILVFGAFITPLALPDPGLSGISPVPGVDVPEHGFLIAMCALVILAAAVAWLVLPLGQLDRTGEGVPRTLAPPRAWGTIFFLLLLVIIGIAGWLRDPRLDHSLWNDEEYSLRRYIWGYQKVQDDGSLKPDRVKWAEVFFFNRAGNNHNTHSITARLSLDAWEKWFKSPDDTRFFSEHAYRLPGYLAGLVGLMVLALLLADLGLPAMGLTAAAFMTLHPWHLRYSVEARGYAWLLLFLLLAVYCLQRALRSVSDDPEAPPRWRWWLGYGLFQFLYMWSFPGALYPAVMLNLGAFAWIAWTQRRILWPGRRPFATALPAWVVVNVASGMLFLQMMAPAIPRIRLYLKDHHVAQGEMNTAWWQDIGAHLISGLQWTQDGDFLDLSGKLRDSPLAAVGFYLTLAAVVLGAIALVLRMRAHPAVRLTALLAGALVLASPLAYTHMALTGNFLFSWYLLYSVPGLCAFAAAAPLLFAGRVRTAPEGNLRLAPSLAAGGLCAVLVAANLALNLEFLHSLRHTPRQPLDAASPESLAGNTPWLGIFAHKTRGPSTGNTPHGFFIPAAQEQGNKMVAVFGVSAEQFRSYAPRSEIIKSGEQLRDFFCRTLTSGQTPVVIKSGINMPNAEDSAILEEYERILKVQRTEATNSFDTVRVYGLEPMFTLDITYFDPLPALCDPSASPVETP